MCAKEDKWTMEESKIIHLLSKLEWAFDKGHKVYREHFDTCGGLRGRGLYLHIYMYV